MANLSLTDRIIINEFKEKNNWICYYCNKNIDIDNKYDLTVDHKTPLSRGGITEESNLAISCAECNREKDNMSEDEYFIFKQKQVELYQSLDFVNYINDLSNVYNRIIEKAQDANMNYNSIEKHIQNIIGKTEINNFNAYQGYLFAKELKEYLKQRNQLRIVKEIYNTLHILIGNNKKQLQGANLKIDDILSEQYKYLKQICLNQDKDIGHTIIKAFPTKVVN
jgi:hypothetical protein